MAALTLSDSGDPDTSVETVELLGELLVILPLLYLIVAALQRRRATWVTIVTLVAALSGLRAQDEVAPSTVFVAVALVVMVWGVLRGQLRRPGPFRAQALGMVGFGGLALIALAVDPDLGRYLAAAGWFTHGLWDLIHLRSGKVVVRSYAEYCGVLDILIAAGLVFLL